MAETETGKRAARAWMREQTRLGTQAARPVILYGLLGTLLAVAQALCMAEVLATALAGHGLAPTPLAGFAALALARAALGYVAELAATDAGAAARRRLRSDALTRLLHAGPSMLRTHHSGDLASIVVDRIEALDGLFSRWVPGIQLAVGAPSVVALAALWADPLAALVLVLCGVLIPIAMAAAGIGAAAASRGQFLALTRLQARFLDRVRGIATIVLAGRAEDEAKSLASAAAELGSRTMRVLRVAFLSSAALDLATVAALALLAVHYGVALRAGTLAQPALALFALLLVPEFFAPLRNFAAAYQDRLHATGAADALIELPPAQPPAATPPHEIRRIGRHPGVRERAPDLGPRPRSGTGRAEFPRPRRRDADPRRPLRRRQIDGDRAAARLPPPRQRAHHDQRRRPCRSGAAGAEPAHRLDRPAPGAVRRLDPRQHPVRQARRHRRGTRCCRPRRPRQRVRRCAAGPARHPGRGGRPRPVRWPGAARRDRPCLPEERPA